MQAVGTHYRPTWIHLAATGHDNWRDSAAGTTILYHLCNYSKTVLLSVMITGLMELLEYGHGCYHRLLQVWDDFGLDGAAGVKAGLLTRRSDTAASGLHDHATTREQAAVSV